MIFIIGDIGWDEVKKLYHVCDLGLLSAIALVLLGLHI